MWAQQCAREAFYNNTTNKQKQNKHMAEISLSRKHEECDRGMTRGVLDQKIHNLALKGLISA